MPQTKEEKAEYMKQYRLDNKEKIKEQSRQYNLDNKEKLAKQKAEYYQSPNGKKLNKISNWKTRGLLWDTEDEIDEIYNRWLISERCELCDEEYTETNVKCMDHEHKDGIYGKFRNVLCHSCNVKTDRQIHSNNKSGVPNIYWSNTDIKWIYKKTINKKIYRRTFINKEDAILYKKNYEESLL